MTINTEIRIVALDGGENGYLVTEPNKSGGNEKIFCACSNFQEVYDYLCRNFGPDGEE